MAAQVFYDYLLGKLRVSDTDQYQKGWFASEAALLVAYPNGIATPSDRSGWNAWVDAVGSPATLYAWDVDANAWFDSGACFPSGGDWNLASPLNIKGQNVTVEKDLHVTGITYSDGGLSVTGTSGLGTVTSGTWNGTAIGWAYVNKTGSSLADLATRNHSSLTLDGGTNPHGTTKSDVGLGSVENTALSTWAGSTNITTLGTIATGTVPWANVSKISSSLADLATKNHSSLTLDGGTNPHGTTKSDVGLGSVENTALSTWAGSTNITTLGTIATGTVPAANVSGLGTAATGTAQTATISAPLATTQAFSVIGAAAPTLSISAASTTAAGSMSAADKKRVDKMKIITIGPTSSNADYECDGTDDHVQFQQAHDAAAAGDTIKVMAGTYQFYNSDAAEFTITKQINLQGSGETTILKRYNLAKRTIYVNSSAAHRYTLSGFKFQQDGTASNGISTVHEGDGFYGHISRCYFEGGDIALHIGNGTIVELCSFYSQTGSVGVGVEIASSKGCVVRDCYFESGNRAIQGMGLGTLIQNNFISGTNYGIILTQSGYADWIGLDICNNRIRVSLDGIVLTSGASYYIRGAVISGNHFPYADIPGGQRYPIKLLGCKDCIIKGNHIEGSSNTFIQLESTGSVHTTGTVISGNIGDSAGAHVYAVREADANQNYTVVSRDNRFATGSSGGVSLQGANSRDDATIPKADVGLGSVENTALSTWAGSTNITTLGTIATGTVPWANVSKVGSSIADLATKNHSSLTLDGGTNPHSTTKSDVGLGSVENTALSTWAGSANITTLGTIATGTVPVANLGDSYQTVYVDAGAMTPCTTNGAAAGLHEYGTNDIDFDYFAFDSGATEERVQFKLAMPDDWDRSTVKVKFYWSSDTGSTAGDTVEWGIKAGALSGNDAIDAALGTAQTISDTLLADNGADLQVSAATAALTVGGTPALGDLVVWEIYRNTDGTDDMAEDAWLLGIHIQYKRTGSPAAW